MRETAWASIMDASSALKKESYKEKQRLATSPSPDVNFRKICKREVGLNLLYCSNFYRKSAADAIFQDLESYLPPYFASCEQTVTLAGRVLHIPRRHAAFGDSGLSYSFSGITMKANPWIPLVNSLRDHVQEALGEKFNFVLVNRYKDGLDHMGEHRDNERELVENVPIASLSLGQARDFIFRHEDSRGRGGGGGGRGGGGRGGGGRGGGGRRNVIDSVKLELGHGSLLVMCPPTNSMWYHSLPVRRRALHPRINLTFRRMMAPSPSPPSTPSTN